MTNVDPKISAYMSKNAKKRKSKIYNFSDPEVAKQASIRGVEARRAKKQALESKDSVKS